MIPGSHFTQNRSLSRVTLVCRCLLTLVVCLSLIETRLASAQIAIQAERLHTMAGPPIRDGVVVIAKGKVVAVGPRTQVNIPAGYQVLQAQVVTPGLVDAHSVVGLAGITNSDHDQDQLESSTPLQPQLRAVDAYNAHDPLVEWVRGFGVTTVHTGHGPGELISGQTMIVKTAGNTVDDVVLNPACAVAATMTSAAQKSGTASPGTRGKMMAMLRQKLIEAQEYSQKVEAAGEDDPPARNLELEALTGVLAGKQTLMITVDRTQDILSALRLAAEFELKIWLDSAAEAYRVVDEIKAAEAKVIVHPTMARATGDRENMSFETAARLREAGIPFALQSGFEGYVPKTRVVLFEAAWAAANGLSFEQALAAITIDAAKLLGVDNRVGSLEVGKDADLAMYDGDPFEYTTHCVGVVINGRLVSEQKR